MPERGAGSPSGRLFLATPGDWVAVSLPMTEGDAERLTEEAIARSPQLASRREVVAGTWRALAQAVAATRPLYAGGTFLRLPGGTLPVTLLVNAIPAGAAGDPRSVMAALGSAQRPGRRGYSEQEVELPAGPAARVRWLQATELNDAGQAVVMLVVQYFVTLHEGRGGLVLSFSSPAVALAEKLATLFDRIARSVEIR
jgi:hypothetical protein